MYIFFFRQGLPVHPGGMRRGRTRRRRRAGAERSGAETTHPCPHPPQSPNGGGHDRATAEVATRRVGRARRGGRP